MTLSRCSAALAMSCLALLGTLLPTTTIASSSTAADFEFPSTTLTKLAFGSCHKQKYVNTSTPSTIWDAIRQQQPDAFVWTGDSVYPPKRGIASVQLLQTEYEQMLTNESLGYASFCRFLGNDNIFGTWDDHDYGGNDLGLEMPDKQERAAAFLKFVGEYNVWKGKQRDWREGVYASVDWGSSTSTEAKNENNNKVRLILLDTRWHREPHCIPSVAHALPMGAAISCITRWLTAGLLLPNVFETCRKPRSILGKEQWKWLESQLSDSDAQVHIIVSSIQVLTSNPVMESWGHYPQERERLLKLVNGKAGVILLSGDVHHAELLTPRPARRVEDDASNTKSTFLEVTSSGMTHTCATPSYGRVLCRPLLESFDAHRHYHHSPPSSSSTNNMENQHHYDNHDASFYIGKNFGTLDIDWENKSFTVFVHDDKGRVVLSTCAVPMDQDKLTDEELEQVTPVNDGHLIPKFRKLLLVVATMILCLILSIWLQKR